MSNKVSKTLFRIGWRHLLRRPLQSFLMVIGITLGVAVIVGIDLANSSASRAFELSTESIAGRTTHQILSGPQGVNEAIYTKLRRLDLGIPIAPVLSELVTSPELGERPFQLLGVDPFAEAPFRSYLGNPNEHAPINGLVEFLTQPGAVFISTSLAERYNLGVCRATPKVETSPPNPCEFTIELSGNSNPVFIAGLLDPNDRLSQRALDGVILTDIATAQELTDQIGKLSYIDVIIPQGDPSTLDALKDILPENTRIQPVAARTGTIEEMTSAFQLNLTALSLLALVVGLFLIYNTMTFSVIQRRSHFGMLRCLGVTRREVFLLVISEALIIGIVGSGLGVLLGILLGQGAVRLVTQTFNDLYFVLTVRDVAIPTSSLIKGAIMGVVATVVTAAFPAWEASSVPPRSALSRSGLEGKASKAINLVAWIGLFVIIIGGILLWLPGRSLASSFAGTFAVVIGFSMLTPSVTKLIMQKMQTITASVWGLLGQMAPRSVVSSISRTSIAVAALMVAVSVTIGISLMVGSFRYTVVTWLSETLQGDVYISPPSLSATQSTNVIDPSILDILSNRSDIQRIDALRLVEVDSPFGPIQVGATNNPNTAEERIFKQTLGDPTQVWQRMMEGAVILSEPISNRISLSPRNSNGLGEITLETDKGPQSFPVAGIYFDYASSQGTVLMALPIYKTFWNDNAINAISLRIAPEAKPDLVTEELQNILTPIQKLDIRPNQTLRDEALVVFDRTFAITSALQILATLVAFIGILSAFLSLQLEKQREFGILRAIGLTAQQLRKLVFLETGLMGAVAGLLSMPTGFVLSLILIYIINKRAFGWTLQMQVTPAPFVEALFVAVFAALVAGIYPARKLGRMLAAEALRSE